MANETKRADKKNVVIAADSHKRAQLAANLSGVGTLGEFLSQAADKASVPILRKHGIDPEKVAVS